MKPIASFIQTAGEPAKWPIPPQAVHKSHYKAILWCVRDGIKDMVEVFSRPHKKRKVKVMDYQAFNNNHIVPAINELMPEGEQFESWGFTVYKWG